MFNLDPAKLLIIAVVAIILLGPDRLPQVARQVGGAWRTFNDFRHRMETEVRGSIPDLPSTQDIARLARSPTALLNHLSNMSTDEAPDGSFQPPTPVSENGTAGAAAAVAEATPASTKADAGTDAPADPAAQAEPGPAPEPAPAPAPNHVERPQRASQPSGVVVPGDPNLN